MASSNELFNLDGLYKDLTKVDGALNNLSTTFMKVLKNTEDFDKASKNFTQTTDNLTKAQQNAADTSRQMDALNKQLATSAAKLQSFDADVYEQIQKNNKALADQKKAINDKVKASEAEEGSLVRMRQKLAELTKEYDNTGKRTKEAAAEIKSLSEQIGKAEEATNRHQRAVGGYKEGIMKAAKEFLGFAGAIGTAVAIIDKMKEAFAETDTGVRFFSKLKEASSTFFNNIITGNVMFAQTNAQVAAQLAGKLDDLRKEEREEQQKVATLDTHVKLLRLQAATTKDLQEQKKLYQEADKAENESIAIRKEHLTAEIAVMTQLSMVREGDSKLLDELAHKKTELISIEGDKNIRIQTKLAAADDKIEAERKKRIKDGEKKEQDRVDAYVKGMEDMISANEKELASKLKAIDASDKESEDALKQLNKWGEEEIDEWSAKEKAKTDATKKATADREKAEKDASDLKRKVQKEEIQMAKEVVNSLFSFNKQRLDNEMTSLENEKKAKLSNSKLTADQKVKIEAEYTKKEGEIKMKQAKNDKLHSLFSIAIATAEATMKTLAKVPLPLGLPLMIATIAMGALQAALVVAQPIPKYAKGTMSAAEKGIFGEAGRELMMLRDSSLMLAEKPTYFEGSKFKGARIFSNPETERMMGMSDRRIQGQSINDDRIIAGLEKLNRTILSKPVAIYDKDHRIIGQATDKHMEVYLNRLTR